MDKSPFGHFHIQVRNGLNFVLWSLVISLIYYCYVVIMFSRFEMGEFGSLFRLSDIKVDEINTFLVKPQQ